MQVENEIHGLLIGSASVVGDNTEQRLGSRIVTQWGRPTRAKMAERACFGVKMG